MKRSMKIISRRLALQFCLRTLFVSSLLVTNLPCSSQAQDTTNTPALQRGGEESTYARRWDKLTTRERESTGKPQVTLALSGGGARGLAHIGVIRAFEEAEIEIVSIAGTSMGGIVGGLYAAGITPDEIEELARKIDFRLLFSNSPRRQSLFLTQRESIDRALFSVRFDNGKPSLPTGFSSAQRLTELLSLLTLRQNYAAGADFTKLSIPFTTVATDISTGEAVILDRGNLADAIRATMAFPLAISPVEIDGRLLMDGGMVEPVPVELARRLIGADKAIKIVAVNTTKRLLPKGGIKDPFDMATQVTTIMSLRELHEELDLADYVITPKVGSGKGADFGNIEDFVSAGYHEALTTTHELLREHQRKVSAKSIVVNRFVVEGVTGLDEALNSLRGKPVTIKRLDEIFQRRWNLGNMVRLDIKSSRVGKPDSLQPTLIHMSVTGTPQPEPSEVTVEVENNFGQRQNAVEELLRQSILALGTVQLDSVAEWAVQDYRKRGIDLCAVRVCIYAPETKTVYLRVDEARSNELTIKGTSRTRPSFVRDRIGSFVRGEPFTVEIARRAYRDIYGSGLFERVSIDVIPTEEGADVEVLVHERNTMQLQLGYHWDDEYHSEGFVKGLESNILGIGMEGSILARFADRRQRFSAGLRTDRIFRTHVAFNLDVYASKLDRRLMTSGGAEIGFRRELRRGASLRIGQQISRFGILSAAAIVEHVESTEPGAMFPEKYNLRKIQIRSLVEDFDRTYFTRRGRRHLFVLESAGKIFGGETEYTKWFSSVESYFPLTERLNFHPKFTAAVSRANLPAPEEFYIGGLGSFEGFRTTELSDSKILLMNLELRYRVLPRIYLITRYNGGNTFDQTEDLSFENLRYGWAAALGIDTPLGPIIFGYGRASGNRDRVHFQAGLKF
jgi:NTE family protein